MIEIEKRALVDKNQYDELLKYFSKKGKLTKQFKRYTIIGIQRADFVPDTIGDKDLRIRTDGKSGLFTFKIGNWHSGDARKEYEIHFDLSEIKDAMGILTTLGSPYCVSVYIERYEYSYHDYVVSLDKYFFNDDYIIDFEKLVSDNSTENIKLEEDKIESEMEKLGLNLITSEKMIEFINKLNFIKKAQHNFKKTSIDEWYKEWEEYIFCRI
jgi:adenylate cyclase class IV